MNTWNELQIMAIMIGMLMIFVILLLVWIIVTWVRLWKLRKQFNQLLEGTEKENLESLLEKLFDRIYLLEQEHCIQKESLGQMADTLQRKKGNVGVVRFNAFANEGSDLSFSIAFIDDKADGFVMTSIFGREESRTYAKPLENGKSSYHLTEEEMQAIEKAQNF
ncbi:DUF4446 family protein [Ammoniphilus sp. 3BR4]|uniref:DUF4446 family protein n=1 Tax=Ammoniphilus sp. 3BR4 TaxID=3158265 RepID=UPI003466C0A6